MNCFLTMARYLYLVGFILLVSACNKSSTGQESAFGISAPGSGNSTGANCSVISFAGLTSAQTLSQNKVQLKFSPAVDNGSDFIYRVYADDSLFTTTTTNPQPGTDGLISVTVNGLDPSTTYSFSVRAYDGCKEDNNTSELNVTTSNSSSIPAQPVFGGIATGQPEGGSGIRLAWSAATDDVTPISSLTYKIFRSTTSLGHDFNTPLATVTGTLNYLDTTAVIGTTYYYIARAYDEDGYTDGNYGEKNVRMLPPIVFSGIVSGQAIAHDKITIKFNPATGGSGTFIFRAYLNGNLSNPHTTASGLSPGTDGLISMTLSGLNIASTYSVVVRVYDGNSEDSNLVALNLTTFPYTVPTFTGVTQVQTQAGINGKTGIIVSWNPATAATGTTIDSYNVYLRSPSGSFDFNTPTTSVTGSSTQALVNGLTANTTYYVCVRARASNAIVESNQVELSVTTNNSGSISFGGLLTAVAAPGISGFSEAILYWSPGSGDYDHYQIFVSGTDPSNLPLNDAFWTAPHSTVYDLSKTNKTITGLTARDTYYFVVRAAYSGDGSNDQNRTARSTIIQAPAPVFAGAASIAQPAGTIGLTSLTVSWATATGAYNQYKIFQKSGGAYNFSGAAVGTVASSATSYTINGLTTGTEYCFIVRAIYDGVAPVSSDANLSEVCATPTVTPPNFAGVASCVASTGQGEGPTTLNISWSEATGAYDTYAIWYSTSSTINYLAAPNEIISEGIISKSLYNLIPDTTYYVGMRARYSGTGSEDANTVVLNCKTNKSFAVFTQLTNGVKTSGGNFLTPTKVCVRDNVGNNQSYVGNITLSLNLGSGTLGGTLTKPMITGCATFSDLTYTSTGPLTILATATYAQSATSSMVIAVDPGTPPAGACLNENANWITAYGGCYSPAAGLVVSAQGSTAILPAAHSWTARADLTFVDLHDWTHDGNNDGRPDHWSSNGSYFFDLGSNGYCHDLVEGGYADWRWPTWEDAIAVSNVLNFETSWSFNPTVQRYYYVARNTYETYNTHRWDFIGKILGTGNSLLKPFCIRTAETTFVLPYMNNDFTATVPAGALGAGSINLTWSPASGSYTGYYLYYATSADGIDYNNPNVVLRSSATSYNVTSLNPGTEYVFAIRPVWTNATPEITDNNTDEIFATTRSAYLSLSFFNGIPLSTGKIPIAVSVLEQDTGALISTSLPVTITQVAGTGSLGGTVTVAATNGIAYFTNLTFSDLSGSGSLQFSASSSITPTITSTLKTIQVVNPGSCRDFNLTVYPEHGGCYYSTLNLVSSSVFASNLVYFYQAVWESGAGPTFTTKEPSDTLDNDGDGLFDDLDPTSNPGNNPGFTGGYCHNLVEGSKTDWRVPRLAEFASLSSVSAYNYGQMVSALAYWTSRTDTTNNQFGYRYTFPNTVSTDGAHGRVFCVRTVP